MPLISWNAVSGAALYEIKRSVDSDSYTFVAAIGETSYIDSDAFTPGQVCSYTVCSISPTGTAGGCSAPVSVIITGSSDFAPDPAPTLAAPTGVKGKMSGGTPYLTWNAVSGAAKYEIYRSVGGGEYTRIGSTTKKYYSDKNFEYGTTYSYKIKAVNGSDVSPLSNAVSVTTPRPAVTASNTGMKPVIY